MKVQVKRVYDAVERVDGFRVLVDRLWPRGITKEKASLDLWMKEVAPSTSLRAWFHEDKEGRFSEFKKSYAKELAANRKLIKEKIGTATSATLLTGVKDIEHSHIPTLVRFLEKL